jgi:hypothetical protein
VRRTRDPGFQPDHVNELPDLTRGCRGRRRSISDSAILSVTDKKLRKTHTEAIAQAMRCKNAIKLRVMLRATKSVSYLVKAPDLSS